MSRVREILNWYGSDNPGTLTNLARMLNHGRLAGSGKMVILPVDQGSEHAPARSFAPNPPAYDPHYHRSQQHTSELQSRLHLVCRLLLDKHSNCIGSWCDLSVAI